MKILTVVRDGFTYRFADLIKVENHYLAHLLRDDNTIGKMDHHITLLKYGSGTFSDSADT